MTGKWTVRLEDGPHTITADLSRWTSMLKVSYDGLSLGSTVVFLWLGEIRRFEKAGHAFSIRVNAPLYVGGHLMLFVDEVEVQADGATVPAVAASAPAPEIQFVKELSAVESDEVLGIEDYPLDNSFGSEPLQTDRQISKECTNDLSTLVDEQESHKLGVTLFSALKADVATRVSKQIGSKVGEKVTESQTLHLSVGVKSAVLYQVIWKRKVRTGEHLYMANGSPVTVPYRVNYGLSCEVHSAEIPVKPAGSAS